MQLPLFLHQHQKLSKKTSTATVRAVKDTIRVYLQYFHVNCQSDVMNRRLRPRASQLQVTQLQTLLFVLMREGNSTVFNLCWKLALSFSCQDGFNVTFLQHSNSNIQTPLSWINSCFNHDMTNFTFIFKLIKSSLVSVPLPPAPFSAHFSNEAALWRKPVKGKTSMCGEAHARHNIVKKEVIRNHFSLFFLFSFGSSTAPLLLPFFFFSTFSVLPRC